MPSGCKHTRVRGHTRKGPARQTSRATTASSATAPIWRFRQRSGCRLVPGGQKVASSRHDAKRSAASARGLIRTESRRPRSAQDCRSARGGDCGKQRLALHRLQQKSGRPGRCAAFANSGIAVPRDDDGGNPDPLVGQVMKKLQAAHVRHLQVGYQTRGRPVGQCREEFPCRRIRSCPEGLCAQQTRQRLQHGRVIVHDGDPTRSFCHGGNGYGSDSRPRFTQSSGWRLVPGAQKVALTRHVAVIHSSHTCRPLDSRGKVGLAEPS